MLFVSIAIQKTYIEIKFETMKKELQKMLHNFFLFIFLFLATTTYSQIGSLDTTLDPDDGPDAQVNSSVALPDGKAMIAGSFSEYNTVSRSGIARINADGTLDTSFNPGTGIPIVVGSITVTVNDLKIQPDGKILIGGNFSTYNNIAVNNLARLNPDGSLDESFVLDARVTREIRSVTLQPDGKIIITGNIFVNGSSKGIARLNADGTLDETFSSYLTGLATGNADFYCTLLLQDGRILIGGSCRTSTTTFLQITKLNSNGTKDDSFEPMVYTSTSTPVISGGSVVTLAVQSDGKILAGGGFLKTVGTSTKYNFIRLNADGSYDSSFNTGSGVGISLISRVNTILPQADQKIIIAGAFSNYNGTSRKGLARINANGTLDTSFTVGTGFVFTAVQHLDIFDDENLLLVGNFTSYNEVTRNRIAKISTRTIIVNSLSATGPFCAGATFDINYTPVGTYNTGNIFTAQLSDTSGDFSNATNIGTLVSEIAGTINVTIPQNALAGNTYKIRIISSAPFATGDIYTANIVISETPLPTAEAIQDFTTGDTLEDFIVDGENIKWYDAQTEGNELQNSELIVGGTIYYVSQTINDCESARLPITAGTDLATDSFALSQLKYFPNPVREILNLEFSENISSIKIYNLIGQQVANRNPNANDVKLDLSNLNSGTYIVKIISGENSRAIKISKL